MESHSGLAVSFNTTRMFFFVPLASRSRFIRLSLCCVVVRIPWIADSSVPWRVYAVVNEGFFFYSGQIVGGKRFGDDLYIFTKT